MAAEDDFVLLGGFCVAEVKHNGRAESRTAHELIVGPTGCGKTWLACALGNAACRQGLSVQYPRATRLLDDLRIAHAHGSYNKKLAQLAQLDLLILDDGGLQKLTRAQAQDLLEVVDDRHGACSLLITRQLPVEHWHDTLGDPTRADAILDRVCHSAHKLLLKGNQCEKPPPKMTRILTHREHLN